MNTDHHSSGEIAGRIEAFCRNGPSRTGFLLVLLSGLCGVLFLSGYRNAEPMINAERRAIEVVRTMYDTGNILIPYLDGHPHLTKPPLYFWLSLGVSQLRGQADLQSLHIVSAIGALLSVLGVFALGQVLVSRQAGWWSALLLLSTYGLFEYAHRGMFDALLSGFVTLAILAYVLTVRRGRRWLWLLVIALTGGFLTKGFLAWLLPLLPIVADVCLRRPKIHWPSVGWTLLTVLLGSLSWYIYLWFADADARRILISVVTVNFGVNESDYSMAFHGRPFWYYLWCFPLMSLPWVLFLVPMSACWRKWWKASSGRTELWLSLSWFIGGVILLSLIPAKAGRYVVPLLPGWALFLGIWLAENLQEQAPGAQNRALLWTQGVLSWVLVIAGLVIPFMLWVRIGSSIGVAAVSGGIVAAVGILGLVGVRRRQPASALCAVILAIVVFSVPLYGAWIPSHRYIHEHHDSPERQAYKERQNRLKNLLFGGRHAGAAAGNTQDAR